MGLSSGERRALAAKGNRLKAHVIIRANELSDATVAHVRQAFGDQELIKVRISTDDRGRRRNSQSGFRASWCSAWAGWRCSTAARMTPTTGS